MQDDFKRIVCPVDFSETSKIALRTALDFAKRSKGKVALVHIVHDPWADVYKTEAFGRLGPKEAQERAEEMLRDFASENAAGAECEFYVECILDGRPGRGVTNFARFFGADLVILTESKGSGLKRSRSWGFSGSIMRRAHCSVLLLRSYEVFEESVLKDKQILVVDDEQDVLDTVSDILDMCKLHTASNYERALEFLSRYKYDVVILDIMGVSGFDLLKKCVELGFPAVMLTAHALSIESIKEAMKLVAVFLLPKERMMDLQEYLEEVVIGGGKPIWGSMFDRMDSYFERKFGRSWEEVKSQLKSLEKEISR